MHNARTRISIKITASFKKCVVAYFIKRTSLIEFYRNVNHFLVLYLVDFLIVFQARPQ